nr:MULTISPECIES: DUF3298 and DUF4163 domain-containing protein [unclassified Pseudoflavonifractor]
MKRGKKPAGPANVDSGQWKHVLKCEEEPVLTLDLRWPRLPDENAALRRISRYYQRFADQWKARWEAALYARACAALAEARENSRPFQPWQAQLVYTVTYNENGLLSLFSDAYEYTGGAHGMTVRCADAWNLTDGSPRSLSSFFPPRSRWRRQVLEAVRTQIAARLATGESVYFDDWEKKAETEFDPGRFYLTQEGVTVFYPLYTLAPYVEGMPAFTIPWPLPPELPKEEPPEQPSDQKKQ